MKYIIYVILFLFLFVPISYAEGKNCIMKKNSVVADEIKNLILYDFLNEIGDEELLKYMFDIRRLGTTRKDIKVKLLSILEDELYEGLDIAEVEIKVKNQNIKIWVFYYNIICNGEEDDKTKRKTPERQEKERRYFKKETRRANIETQGIRRRSFVEEKEKIK